MEVIHISLGGPDRSIGDANGRRWKFEMHPQFGPITLNSTGNPGRQPGSRSLFWHAVDLWIEQGEKIDEAGNCVWEEPKPLKLQHLGGRNYRIVTE